MVIGNGLLARAFHQKYGQDKEVIIFASGVSNSQELSGENFYREELLLKEELRKKEKIIYFSTCSVYDETILNTPYVAHKIRMERIISCSSLDYLIFRLPQIVGRTTNQNTLINFIYESIKNKRRFNVYESAKRNIIDVEHVAAIGEALIENQLNCKTINIANTESIGVLSVVHIFEKILSTKADYFMVPGGSSYDIDIVLCKDIAKSINLVFDKNYVENCLNKYYA